MAYVEAAVARCRAELARATDEDLAALRAKADSDVAHALDDHLGHTAYAAAHLLYGVVRDEQEARRTVATQRPDHEARLQRHRAGDAAQLEIRLLHAHAGEPLSGDGQDAPAEVAP